MWETWVRSLGREDPLEKEMAPHSSTLAWRIPWREEPGRLQSMGSQRVGHDWVTSLSLFTFKDDKRTENNGSKGSGDQGQSWGHECTETWTVLWCCPRLSASKKHCTLHWTFLFVTGRLSRKHSWLEESGLLIEISIQPIREKDLEKKTDSWVGKIHWRTDGLSTPVFLGFPGGSAGKESSCNVGNLGSISGLGRFPGEGNSYPLQFSGLENSTDYTVHGVAKS